jgi:hypothetical protein
MCRNRLCLGRKFLARSLEGTLLPHFCQLDEPAYPKPITLLIPEVLTLRILQLAIRLTVLLGGFWLQPSKGYSSEALAVTSPDGSIPVSFQIKANPQPYLPEERAYYRVSYRGVPLLRVLLWVSTFWVRAHLTAALRS